MGFEMHGSLQTFTPVQKRVTYFTVKGAFGFKSETDARQWAEQIARGDKRTQIHITYSNVTRDWAAEVHN